MFRRTSQLSNYTASAAVLKKGTKQVVLFNHQMVMTFALGPGLHREENQEKENEISNRREEEKEEEHRLGGSSNVLSVTSSEHGKRELAK